MTLLTCYISCLRSLTSSGARTPRRRRVGALASQSGQYSPLSAAGLFTQALEVETTISHPYAADDESTPPPETSTATFRVYSTAPEVGVQHGATVFVCVHGAGYSGLSYARFAKSLVDLNRDVERQAGDGGENVGKIGVLAYDARGHGEFKRERYLLPHMMASL